MKISRQKLAEIIKEECNACDMSVPDHNEGSMALRQLFNMENNARELSGMLPDDADLPEWVSSKLTKAADYLDSVKDYLDYDLNQGKYDQISPCNDEISHDLTQMSYSMDDVIAEIIELLNK